jgi:hypothetical protein
MAAVRPHVSDRQQVVRSRDAAFLGRVALRVHHLRVTRVNNPPHQNPFHGYLPAAGFFTMPIGGPLMTNIVSVLHFQHSGSGFCSRSAIKRISVCSRLQFGH